MSKPSPNGVTSRWVPYFRSETSAAARQLLPDGPALQPTTDQVRRLRKAYRRGRPEAREVLGTLRAFSVNGAETPLAGVAALTSAIAITVALFSDAPLPWARGLWLAGAAVLTIATSQFVKIAFAAHSRRVVAVVWLGAYEDELRR